MNTLAERIRHAREVKQLSQQEIAEKAGISQPTYFKIENGLTKKPRNILEIAHALEVNPHWLVTGEGTMMGEPSPTPNPKDTPSTSTIELIQTLKDMEKSGELTPPVVGLLNTTLNTVKAINAQAEAKALANSSI